MTLRDLLSKFENSTIITIECLDNASTKHIYSGVLYGYGNAINDIWPDNTFKEFDVVNCFIKDNVLNILIES